MFRPIFVGATARFRRCIKQFKLAYRLIVFIYYKWLVLCIVCVTDMLMVGLLSSVMIFICFKLRIIVSWVVDPTHWHKSS